MVGTVTIGVGESTEKRELVEATCLPADKSRRVESSIGYVSTRAISLTRRDDLSSSGYGMTCRQFGLNG